MIGGPSKEDGCFLRVYYPSQIKDAHVSGLISKCLRTLLVNLFSSCFQKEHSSRWASWLPHPKYVEGYTIVLGMIPFFGKKLISWAFGV